MGVGGVGVVKGALEEVLVDAGDVMVGLDLTAEIVGVEGKGASVLADLLHGLQRLHHLSPFVQQLLPHPHFLARWLRLRQMSCCALVHLALVLISAVPSGGIIMIYNNEMRRELKGATFGCT